MIRRIILENYMAHGRTVIEPAAGLTVLVGPNNCGKSAVAHALQTLCYNRPADFAVRHGEKEASVTVETDDGHVLTWQRRKNVVSYVIDGREIGRLGQGGVPDDLHRYLRMPRIDPPNESGAPFFVHFGLQKSPIFLLDDPPARAATFFASSSDAEKLLEMQKRHREKVKETKRDHDRLGSEAAGLDRRLEATAGIGDLAEGMTQLEASYRGLAESDRAIASRRELIDRLDRGGKRREKQAGRVRAAQPLEMPPRLAETEPLRQMIARLGQRGERLRHESLCTAAVGSLQAPPAWNDTAELRQMMDRLARVETQLQQAGAIDGGLVPLVAPPAWNDTTSLRQMMAKLSRAQNQFRELLAIDTGLAPLIPPPAADREGLAAMKNLLLRGKELAARRGAAKAEMLLAESAIDAVRERVQAWVEANPNCPTCGAPSLSESVLEAEHQHA